MPCRESMHSAPARRPARRFGALVRSAAVAGLFLAASPVQAVAGSPIVDDEASAFIEHLGRRVIALLSDPQHATKRKMQTFERIFSEAVDLDLIGRQVLGRHWRTATRAQRARYLPLFGRYVVQIYAAQFSNYSGESFDVLKEQQASPTERIVKTRIIRDNGEITYLDFRVRKTGDRFRVVDVAIRGVSLLVAKRSEFDAIVRRRGVNGLLDLLEQRVAQTAAHAAPGLTLAAEPAP